MLRHITASRHTIQHKMLQNLSTDLQIETIAKGYH